MKGKKLRSTKVQNAYRERKRKMSSLDKFFSLSIETIIRSGIFIKSEILWDNPCVHFFSFCHWIKTFNEVNICYFKQRTKVKKKEGKHAAQEQNLHKWKDFCLFLFYLKKKIYGHNKQTEKHWKKSFAY